MTSFKSKESTFWPVYYVFSSMIRSAKQLFLQQTSRSVTHAKWQGFEREWAKSVHNSCFYNRRQGL